MPKRPTLRIERSFHRREEPARAAALRLRPNWRRPAYPRYRLLPRCPLPKWSEPIAWCSVTASCTWWGTPTSTRRKKRKCAVDWWKKRWKRCAVRSLKAEPVAKTHSSASSACQIRGSGALGFRLNQYSVDLLFLFFAHTATISRVNSPFNCSWRRRQGANGQGTGVFALQALDK